MIGRDHAAVLDTKDRAAVERGRHPARGGLQRVEREFEFFDLGAMEGRVESGLARARDPSRDRAIVGARALDELDRDQRDAGRLRGPRRLVERVEVGRAEHHRDPLRHGPPAHQPRHQRDFLGPVAHGRVGERGHARGRQLAAEQARARFQLGRGYARQPPRNIAFHPGHQTA